MPQASVPPCRGALEQNLSSLAPQIFRFVYVLCGKRDDAEEMTQETLATVGAKINQLRDPNYLKPWAFSIAQNVHRMKQRAWAIRSVREVSLDAAPGHFGALGEIVDGALLPDEAAFWAEMRKAIARAIRELPEIYRTVVVLRDVNGCSTAEAAEILSVSADVVKTRLRRARLQLRRRLHRFHPV